MREAPPSRSSALVLTALSGAMLCSALGISIVTVALPTLTRAFSATVPHVQWVILAYLVSITVAIVSAGRLADLLGHRRVLVGGLVLFMGASLACAGAPTLAVLIVCRVIQGLGGAILMALPLSIARDMVSTERLGAAMGLMGTMSAIGTALGPSLGGALIAGAGWRAPFLLLVAAAAVTLVLTLVVIPADARRPAGSLKKLDPAGTGALVVALAAYALLASAGDLAWGRGSMLAIMLVAAGLFVVVELRAASPLVPMHLLGARKTGTSLAMNLLVGAIMMSTLVVGPFFLSFRLGLNEALVGLVMAVGPLAAAFSGVPAGRLTDRIGADRALVAGLCQMIAGLLCLAFLPRALDVWGYVVALMLLTPGFQLFLAANNTAVMVEAPQEQRGRLSGLLGLSRNLGLMSGASAMPALFVMVLGKDDIAGAPGADVAKAFSATFTVAAALALVAIVLARIGTRRGSLVAAKV